MSKKKRNWIPWMEEKRRQRKELEFMCAVCNKAIEDMWKTPQILKWTIRQDPLVFYGGDEMRQPFRYEVR